MHKDIFCHNKYKCSCGFETTSESAFAKHKEESAGTDKQHTKCAAKPKS